MRACELLVEKCQELAELLRGKPYAAVPDKIWEKAAKDLDKLLKQLTPYYAEPKVPSKADIKIVKEHGITSQVKVDINKDADRKAFFSLDYFREKYSSLPDKSLSQALPTGKTKDAYLTAFLVYHYWKARPQPEHGLEHAAKEIETDYQNSDGVKQVKQAKALYRELLGESELNRIVAVLEERFHDKAALSAFAKAVPIKIPSGKKPIHERLAAKILKAGEIVRAKF